MVRLLGPLAVTLLAGPVWAQGAPLQLSYSAYAGGLNVVDVHVALTLHPEAYRLELGYRLTGLVGVVIRGDAETTVDGQFQGDRAAPRVLFSTGHLRGQPRVTQIDWRGGNPVVIQLVPPAETERDPVPAAEQAQTIDTLSAIAALLHRVALTGRCEGAANTFDGRRLSVIEAHTVGEEMLEATSRSSFHGPALRCDVEGRQLAGFMREGDQAALHRPQHGSAWFARLAPGEPPVPVRITFETRFFGAATMYLTGAS